ECISSPQSRLCNLKSPLPAFTGLMRRESVTRCRMQSMTTSELHARLERIGKRLRRSRKWRERRRRRAHNEIPYQYRRQLEDAAEFDGLCGIRKTEPGRVTPTAIRVRDPRDVPRLSDSDYQIRMAEWRQYVALNSKPTRRDPYNL